MSIGCNCASGLSNTGRPNCVPLFFNYGATSNAAIAVAIFPSTKAG